MTPHRSTAARLRFLPLKTVQGREVPVAVGFHFRLAGLAGLRREHAGAGLLIPRCSSVHTFGMRFALDVFFLDERGEILAVRHEVRPCRFASDRRAAAVLEIPSERGESFQEPRD